MLRYFALVFLFFTLNGILHAQEKDVVHIGVLTDVQYCDCPSNGVREYRLSLAKLDSCIEVLNTLPLQGIFHLGDMTDRYEKSMDSVLPRFSKFKVPVNFVLGNHEYMIGKKYRPAVQSRIGLKEPYYTVDIGDWRFIILNGNDLSLMAPQTRQQQKERNKMLISLFAHFQGNGMLWNGGIGSVQMQWLAAQLKQADDEGKKVIVMCHFPLIGQHTHILYNNTAVLNLLSAHPSVKAYFCGHYHDGGYLVYNGIHMVNFKGMLNTRSNAFSAVTLTKDSILIDGYGREPDRELKIRQ